MCHICKRLTIYVCFFMLDVDMAKRVADTYLTDRNYNDDDDVDEEVCLETRIFCNIYFALSILYHATFVICENLLHLETAIMPHSITPIVAFYNWGVWLCLGHDPIVNFGADWFDDLTKQHQRAWSRDLLFNFRTPSGPHISGTTEARDFKFS